MPPHGPPIRGFEDVIRAADLVAFATVAGTPHIHDPEHFAHHPLAPHVSLRDLSPEITWTRTTSSTTWTTV